MRLRAIYLRPLFALGLMLGLSSVAFAQIDCSVSGNPRPRATDTGLTEPAGTVSLLCEAFTADPVGDVDLTVNYGGVIITNDDTVPAGREIDVDPTGDLFAGETVTFTVDNEEGVINITVDGFTPGSGENGSITIRNVLVALAGTGASNVTANLALDAPGDDWFLGGNSSQTVITSVLPGINDPVVQGDPARVLTNGELVGGMGSFELRVTENYVDMFRSAADFNAGVTTNGVQLLFEFGDIPENVEITCAPDAGTGIADFSILSPAGGVLDEDDNELLVEIDDSSLTSTRRVQIDCTVTDTPSTLDPGDVTVQVTLAPVGDALDEDDLVFAGGGDIPRYDELLQPSEPLVVVNIVPATTTLLIPFGAVIPEAGWDVGIAVANPTTDPFDEATPQDGPVTFHFFPNDGSASFQVTTGVVESGQTMSILLSELIDQAGEGPDFLGYVFIVAEFTNAHGASFLTDFGGFAAAGDVLVVDRPRPTTFESLGK